MTAAVFLEDPEARIKSPHENLSLPIKIYAFNSSSHGKKLLNFTANVP